MQLNAHYKELVPSLVVSSAGIYRELCLRSLSIIFTQTDKRQTTKLTRQRAKEKEFRFIVLCEAVSVGLQANSEKPNNTCNRTGKTFKMVVL